MGPEAGSDVFEIAVAVVAVEALVGGGLLQGAQVLDHCTKLRAAGDIPRGRIVPTGRHLSDHSRHP